MDWQAKWIWAGRHIDTPNCYVYARRELDAAQVTSASIWITCSSEYKLYVNGRYVGRGPGPCIPSLQYYDHHDVAHALRSGKNVVAVICYNYGVDTQFRPRTQGGLLLQIETANGNGSRTVLGTDEQWRVRPADDWDFGSARILPTSGFQEVYDSRLKPVGWNVVGFDDSDWEEPAVLGDAGIQPWTCLVPRPIPMLREVEVFPQRIAKCGSSTDSCAIKYPASILRSSAEPATIPPGGNVLLVVDMGREVAGFPIVRVRDGGSGTVDISASKAVDGSGAPSLAHQPAMQADRLILHGGRQEWQAFGRREFRYLQLTFRDLTSPLQLESVSVNTIGYPVERVSSFECSDPLLNRVWDAGVGALAVSMQDNYETSGQPIARPDLRKVRALALQNYYVFFDRALVEKALRDAAHLPPDNLPGQAQAWAVLLHEYYLHTGGRALVETLYPDMHRLMRDAARGGDAASMAQCYLALRCAAKLASALGQIEDTVAWHDQAEALSREFNEEFWNDELGAYVDEPGAARASTSASALAVLAGLADTSRSQRIADLLRSSERGGNGDFHTPSAMARVGLEREALSTIRSVWGEMLDCGAATRCEASDSSEDGEAVSSGAIGDPASWAPTHYLPAEVLGVKPSLPESGVVVIQPRIGDLDWARGHIRTARTEVDVEWHSAEASFEIEINAPEGFVVALPVGGFQSPVIAEIDMGPDTPERRARTTYGWGNVIWRDGEEHDPYLDWLATQEEKAPAHYQSGSRCTQEGGYLWVRECAFTHVRYEIREASS